MADSFSASIQNVSDTALWVAHYRALESQREDALFRDPLAQILTGVRAQKIAESMKSTSAHTRQNVIIRTVIIDRFLQNLGQQGVDTVINLGAGLDTRPYRLALPAGLRWIEVDYPSIIDFKTQRLAQEKPQVHLERVSLDLADREKRQAFFQKWNQATRKAVVLTEGVLPYLTPDQVSTLAEDLYAQKNFHYWIADYISPAIYKYLRSQERLQQMKNAPFQFYPDHWLDFFKTRSWIPEKIEYITEESIKLHRALKMPWWFLFARPFISKQKQQEFLRASGYMLMVRALRPRSERLSD